MAMMFASRCDVGRVSDWLCIGDRRIAASMYRCWHGIDRAPVWRFESGLALVMPANQQAGCGRGVLVRERNLEGIGAGSKRTRRLATALWQSAVAGGADERHHVSRREGCRPKAWSDEALRTAQGAEVPEGAGKTARESAAAQVRG